jgi:misacylated tRNA(Ala) deacylase
VASELLYLTDAYLREFAATVVATDEGRHAVALNKTAFYPGGGGQPADRGTLNHATVTTAHKDENGLVWHALDPDTRLPGEQQTVTGAIDWKRRHALMRTHMALHLVNAVAWIDYRARVTGASMDPGKGRVDMELESMSKQFGQEIEQRVNGYVEQDLEISTVFIPRREADADPAIYRGKASSIPLTEDPVRTVVIAHLDRQACSGTHVASTREIGPVKVTKTESKGRANKRVKIELL